MQAKGESHALRILLASVLFVAWPACAASTSLTHNGDPPARATATRIKPASGSATLEKAVAPLDAGMEFSVPKQLTILEPLPDPLIKALNQASAKDRTRRLQIGLNRNLDNPVVINRFTTRPEEWTLLTNGWRILSAQLVSAGALGLRLHFEEVSLPAGAQLVIYDPANPALPAVVLDAKSFGTMPALWAPTIFSAQTRIECQLPPGVDPRNVSFTISGISHIYSAPVAPDFLKFGECENDVSCFPSYAEQANGVGLISYVAAGNTYLCTGCLLATTQHSPAEYFLTARHCIGSQALASTLEFYWLFQTPSCNGTPPVITSVPTTTGGADLLATGISDFTLLRLRRAAPAGVSYLGWSINRPSATETLVGIHHPDGTFKRISFGSYFDSDIYYWAVQWTSGVTEPGSSGSPLFNGDHQVIGQLTGGYNGPGSSCDNPSAPDEYGRFDVTYPLIQKWIDPSGSSGGPVPVAGTFYALFDDQSTGVVPGSSGSLTVTTTAKGRLSGKIQLGGSTYPFTGQLDLQGTGNITINRRALSPLGVQFQINLGQGADSLTGLVSDGNWTATMSGDRAVFDGRTSFSAQTGRYTLILRGRGDPGPGGNSYGTVLVDKAGRLTFVGSLADGTKASQSTFVSRNGQWPLYVPLYGGKGYLFSWVTFSSTDAGDLGSQLYWDKEARNGFSIVTDLTGSAYVGPGSGSNILNFSDGLLALSGGGLSQNIQGNVQLRPDGRVIDESGLRLSLRFALATGTLTGSVVDPGTKRPIAVHGVALQKQNIGSGYFMGGNLSGQAVIQP